MVHRRAVERSVPSRETVTGRARGMALGGDAVFVLEDGRVVFVPRGAPGDVAELALDGKRRGVWQGRLAALRETGPDRVEAPCPFFHAGCGGCQWQQLGYAAQVAQKQQLLSETLHRLGKLDAIPLIPPLPAPSPWHYRTAIEVHVDADGCPAFMAARSHVLVPVDHCLISHPLLERLLAALGSPLARTILHDRETGLATVAGRVASADGVDRLLLTLHAPNGKRRPARRLATELQRLVPEVASVWHLAEQEDGIPAASLLVGERYLPHVVGGRRFFLGPRSFFQVNQVQTETLVRLVRGVVQQEPPRKVVDLFCGVGLFALSVADLAEQVIGVEVEAEAVRLAERALEQSDPARPPLGRVEFLRAAAEEVSAEVLQEADMVILDPPRSGLPDSLIDRLVAQPPRCLIYVSCEPSTLARDLRRLTGAGWQLASVELVDLFPQTYHIESVTVLRRP